MNLHLVIPELDAYESRHQYHVWCVYCSAWHHHGKGDGHRTAHCSNPNSPYHQTGYVIKRVGPWSARPAVRRLHLAALLAAWLIAGLLAGAWALTSTGGAPWSSTIQDARSAAETPSPTSAPILTGLTTSATSTSPSGSVAATPSTRTVPVGTLPSRISSEPLAVPARPDANLDGYLHAFSSPSPVLSPISEPLRPLTFPCGVTPPAIARHAVEAITDHYPARWVGEAWCVGWAEAVSCCNDDWAGAYGRISVTDDYCFFQINRLTWEDTVVERWGSWDAIHQPDVCWAMAAFIHDRRGNWSAWNVTPLAGVQ